MTLGQVILIRIKHSSINFALAFASREFFFNEIATQLFGTALILIFRNHVFVISRAISREKRYVYVQIDDHMLSTFLLNIRRKKKKDILP